MTEKVKFWDRTKMQSATQAKLTYMYGGKYANQKDVNVFLTPDGFLQYGLHRLALVSITGVNMKHEDQVFEHMKSRLTVTRMALLGPLALAAPKRKIQKNATVTKYLLIDYSEDGVNSSMVFSGKSCNLTMNHIRNWLNENKPVAEEVQFFESPQENSDVIVDPFEEIRKFKELLDMGIINEEEFNAKKKELLGL